MQVIGLSFPHLSRARRNLLQMANLPQFVLSALTLGSMLLSGVMMPSNAGPLPVVGAPLSPASADVQVADAGVMAQRCRAMRAFKARISHAAICTEDVSQISFSEYTVDWTSWMNEVANRWSLVFNAGFPNGKFQPDGPGAIQFTCNSDGSIKNLVILTGSGDIVCDKTQVEALKNCVPLPQFPAACKKDNVTLLYVWDYGVDVRAAMKRVAAKQKVARAKHTQIMDSAQISVSGKSM